MGAFTVGGISSQEQPHAVLSGRLQHQQPAYNTNSQPLYFLARSSWLAMATSAATTKETGWFFQSATLTLYVMTQIPGDPKFGP